MSNNLALCWAKEPFTLCFLYKIHLQDIIVQLGGKINKLLNIIVNEGIIFLVDVFFAIGSFGNLKQLLRLK